MKSIRKSLYFLLAAFVLSSCLYWLGKVKNYPTLEEISLSIAGVALGIIATTWLIDRIVSENASKERDRMRRTAYEHLKTILQKHVYFLQSAYKASRSSRPDSLPRTVSDLLNHEFIETLRELDLDKTAPVMPSRTWAIHFAEECRKYSGAIHSAIDRYLIVLDSPEVKRLERAADSGLVNFVKHLPAMQAENRVIGRRLGNIFDGATTLLSEHVAHFLVIVNAANSLISPLDQIEPVGSLWADNIAPSFGDSVADK